MVSHVATLSDHFAVKMTVNIPVVQLNKGRRRSTYWKLNNAILEEESFMESFKLFWNSISSKMSEFPDVADWWDLLAKPSIKDFCISFSILRKQRRNSNKKFLLSYLKVATENKDWNEVF